MSENPLQPLANALLAARRLCPEDSFLSEDKDQEAAIRRLHETHHCQCKGTGYIWPEPLDWLAGQVLRGCCVCDGLYPDCDSCGSKGWVPFDPEALEWPEGWAYGLGEKWRQQHLSAFRPRALRYQKWYDVLGDALSDSSYAEGEGEAIAALVETVKAIAKESRVIP